MDNEFELKTEHYCFRHDVIWMKTMNVRSRVAEDNDAKTPLACLAMISASAYRIAQDSRRGRASEPDASIPPRCVPLGEYRRARATDLRMRC